MVGAAVKHDEGELHATLVSLVGVDAVVAAEQDADVLGIHGTAEELHAIIQVECYFDVIDRSARSDTREGDSVDLVVLADDGATVPYAYVLESSGVVIRFEAAVEVAIDTLDASLEWGFQAMNHRTAQKDETTPEPRRGEILRGDGRAEGDWLSSSTGGLDASASFDNDGGSSSSAVVAIGQNGGSGFDGEHGSTLNEDLRREQVRVVVPPGRVEEHVAGDVDNVAIHVGRRARVLIEPGEPDEPVVSGRKGALVVDLIKEGVSLGIIVNGRECVAAWERARVVEERRLTGISHDLHELRVLVQCGELGVLRRARPLRVHLHNPARPVGEDDVVRREEEEVVAGDVAEGLREGLPCTVVLEETRTPNIRDDEVPEGTSSALAEPQDCRRLIIRTDGADVIVNVTNEQRVVERRGRTPVHVGALVFRVHFCSVIRVLRQHHVGELDGPGVSFVRVDRIVPTEQNGYILDVHRTAEKLHTIVQVERDLNVVDGGSPAHSAERDTVDLVVLSDHGATMPDADVLKHTGTVIGVVPSVDSTGTQALDRVCAPRVDRSSTKDDESTPQATPGKIVLAYSGSESDWRGRCSKRHDLRALLDDQRGSLPGAIVGVGEDRGTLLDR
eukprot:scaffold7582_cov525-Pinguiococcus_pyrenoidosus.AAC.1